MIAMMIMLTRWLTCCAVTGLATGCLFAQTVPHVKTFPPTDTTGLTSPNAKTEAVKYLGRKSVRITVEGEDHEALVLLPGTDFQDGVIEADFALKSATPPGVRFPGFVGIAFRVRPDASHYELFYLRPGNSDAPDQLMRNHAVSTSRSRASDQPRQGRCDASTPRQVHDGAPWCRMKPWPGRSEVSARASTFHPRSRAVFKRLQSAAAPVRIASSST